MEASSFLSSWLSSVWQLVRRGVGAGFLFWRRLEALFGYRAAFWPDVEIATFLSLLRSWIFCFCSHGGRRSAAGLTAVAATRCELLCDSDAAATQSEPLHGSVAAFFGLEGAGSEGLLGRVLGLLVRDVRSSIARRSWGLRGSCRRGGCGSRRYANSYRDVEGFQNDVGALVVDGAFEDGIDHMHDGGGWRRRFNQSYGMDFGVDTSLYALDHAGAEIAKVFLLERGGTAAVSAIWMWVQRRRFGCRGVGKYREIRVFS
jgi:hypothetical protein